MLLCPVVPLRSVSGLLKALPTVPLEIDVIGLHAGFHFRDDGNRVA